MQAIELAEHDVGRVFRQHQPRIMLHPIKPAATCRFADKRRIGRQQPRHRMVEAAHQGAVDEEAIGDHGLPVIPGREPNPECRSVGSLALRGMAKGESQSQAATTSSLTTTNFCRSIRPKLVVNSTSAASRPVAIRMRPMRGWLWRASNVYHWPER